MKHIIRVTLFLSLLGLLSLQCTRRISEPLSPEVRRQLNLLPEKTMAVTYLNVQKLLKSPLVKSLRDSAKHDPFQEPEMQELIQKTGFDPRRDIREMFVAVSPNSRHKKPDMVAVIHGKFDPEKLIAFVQEKAPQEEILTEQFEDFTLYNPKNNAPFWFCFPEKNYMVVGKKELLQEWLTNYRRGSGPGLPREMMKIINDLKFKQDAWFVMDPTAMVDRIADNLARKNKDERLEAVRSLQELAFCLKLDKSVQFEGIGLFADPEKAQLFHDAVKGAIAAAKLAVNSDRATVDVLNKIKVKLDNHTLRIAFGINRFEVERLLAARQRIAMW